MKLSLGYLLALMTTVSISAQDAVRLVAESDIIVESEFLFIGSTSAPAVNAQGGWATRIHVGSTFGDNYGANPARAESFLIGNVNPITTTVGTLYSQLDREDATRLEDANPGNDPSGTAVGSRTYFVTEFGGVDLDNAGNLAYSADVVFEDTSTPGPDFADFSDRVNSVWVNDTPIAVEGDALTDTGLVGSNYTFVGLVGLGESGGVVYRAGYSDGSSSGSGIFKQSGQQLFGTGDAIGGTTTTVASVGNSAVSLDGSSWLTAADGVDGNEYLVVDGNAVKLRDGTTYIGGDPIGAANGGRTATETLPTTFNNPAVGAGGQWGFTGFTDDVADPGSDFDSVAMINGSVTFRELDTILNNNGVSVTIDGSAEQVAFNSDGDVLVIWDNAVILNGTVIATVGTDIVNDTADLRTFQSGAGLSDRDGNGDLEVYFRGRNDSTVGATQNNDTHYTLTSAFDNGAILGDLDINGVLDLDDICAFAIAFLDPFEYTGVYGSAADARGDFTGDGLVNLADVSGFAALLGVEESVVLAKVPEPKTALVLLVLSLIIARRKPIPN